MGKSLCGDAMIINIAAHTLVEKLFAQKQIKLRQKYHYVDDGLIEYRDRKGRLTASVPCWRAHLIDHSKYTGEKLRAIRAKNGVGRPTRNK